MESRVSNSRTSPQMRKHLCLSRLNRSAASWSGQRCAKRRRLSETPRDVTRFPSDRRGSAPCSILCKRRQRVRIGAGAAPYRSVHVRHGIRDYAVSLLFLLGLVVVILIPGWLSPASRGTAVPTPASLAPSPPALKSPGYVNATGPTSLPAVKPTASDPNAPTP